MRPSVRFSLGEEHVTIRRAAACLRQLADRATEDEFDGRAALELLEFFEDFADGMHQEKEERCLFPALVASGVAKSRVSALTSDHARERALLERMREDVEGAVYGDALMRDEFVWRARQLAGLQTSHANQEDALLLPLADELLEPSAQRRVLRGFGQVEAERLKLPAAKHRRRLRRIAGELGMPTEAERERAPTRC